MTDSDTRLPREVWIASITQTGLHAKDSEEMVGKFLRRMESFVPMQPDIFCLPEAFPFVQLEVPRPPDSEVAETPPGPITERFAEFARAHNCYVICPIYTEEGGRYYNAAVVIDRGGQVMGEYRKAHLTVGEMDGGLTPGTLQPTVFETDFGRIGIQICYDIEWTDGWQGLRDSGAEMVFWPSAFAGGQKLNMLASIYHYVVVSSTRKDTTVIVDISGEEIVRTGRWDAKGVCAPVNLEKAFLHTYPFNVKFDAIRAKYGRKVLIRTFHDEEWTIVESRSPEVKVTDVLAEFEVITHDEMTAEAAAMQAARRQTAGK